MGAGIPVEAATFSQSNQVYSMSLLATAVLCAAPNDALIVTRPQDRGLGTRSSDLRLIVPVPGIRSETFHTFLSKRDAACTGNIISMIPGS